jgi:hypothetical protein
VEENCCVGLNKCSNMAIIRNIEIKMAVATKPKEIALIDVPKLFHGPSSSTPPTPPVCECDGPGFEAVYTSHVFDLSLLKLLILSLFNLFCFCSNSKEKEKRNIKN